MNVMLVSNDARLTLVTPGGSTLTPSDTSAANGITYWGTAGSGFEGFRLAPPAVGTWTINVDATGAAAAQTYGIVVAYASPYVPELRVTRSPIYAGDSLRVRATLTVGGVPVPAVSWACQVRRPDSSVVSMPVYDDGAHGDSLPVDGIYGGVRAPGGGLGDYRIRGVVSLMSGESFAAGADCQLAQRADLAVDSTDIRLSKYAVVAGDSVTVLATVHNVGAVAAMGVEVDLTDQLGYIDLGRGTMDIPAGGSATVQVPWKVALPDTHRIQVSISPGAFVREISYTNNRAARLVVLGQPVNVGTTPVARQLWFAAPRPNPSRGTVTLEFRIPREADVLLEMFDVMGRRLRTWQWLHLAAGTHAVEWDGVADNGQAAAPGVFICKLRAAGQATTQKLVFRR